LFRLENDKASKFGFDDSDFLAVRFISDSLICAIYEDFIKIIKIQVKRKEFLFIASPKISVKLSPKTNHLMEDSKYHIRLLNNSLMIIGYLKPVPLFEPVYLKLKLVLEPVYVTRFFYPKVFSLFIKPNLIKNPPLLNTE